MPIPSLSDIERSSNSASAFAAGAGAPGGSTGQVQFNNAGAFGGADGVSIENGNLRLADSATVPAAPAINGLGLFGFEKAGRSIPNLRYANSHQLRSSIALQSSLFSGTVAILQAAGGANALHNVGFPTMTNVGTITARPVSVASFFTRMHRVGVVSVATAGGLASIRASQLGYTTGNNSGLGGFLKICKFGISDAAAVAGARMFVGMAASTSAPTNVEPSTLVNCIGIGHGAADANFKLFYGGSVAQTPIDLGVNFPCNTRSTDMYELILYSPSFWVDASGVASAVSTIFYQVSRLGTAFVASGVITASGPAGSTVPSVSTVLSGMWAYRTNNATALAVAWDLMQDYIETGL